MPRSRPLRFWTGSAPARIRFSTTVVVEQPSDVCSGKVVRWPDEYAANTTKQGGRDRRKVSPPQDSKIFVLPHGYSVAPSWARRGQSVIAVASPIGVVGLAPLSLYFLRSLHQ